MVCYALRLYKRGKRWYNSGRLDQKGGSKWGKLKTVSQMVMIIVLLIHFNGYAAWIIEQVLIYLALVLTVVSLIDYLYKNRQVMSSQK